MEREGKGWTGMEREGKGWTGMDSYWNCADGKWAFDTTLPDNIRVSAYKAGVVEGAWEILDDMLQLDHVQIQLGDLMSHGH